jgi:mannose-6-phosphate isomerase
MIHRLHNPVRAYAWGSRTHIARLTARDLEELPAAEMWIGCHPRSPSRIGSPEGLRLRDLIAQAPEPALGGRVRARFGDELPFLMKLLAASEPLSLQVHPPRDRAERRFAEQLAAGIPLDARERSYPDPLHKPELLYALTRFEGMAGFRDVHKTAAILRALHLDWLEAVADQLERSDAPGALRSVVTRWLALPESAVRGMLADVRAAALSAEARAHAAPRPRRPVLLEASEVARESLRVYSATVPLIDRYPVDPGVLVTLLLNHVVLAPGEAMFIEAGVVHAYTSGFGVEIMASSDNVLRAGLTPKHVDIPELLQVADFTPIDPPYCAATPIASGIRLSPPIDEFELLVLQLNQDSAVLAGATPRLALCLRDTVELHAQGTTVTLEQGDAVFVEAASGSLTASGHGRLAIGQPASASSR